MNCSNRPKTFVIAIDGPAGAGKSTVARELARRLGFLYIDTGAMYRALTLKALRLNTDFNKTEDLVSLSKETQVDLLNKDDGSVQILLDGEDVSGEIRVPNITKFVSDLARIPGVRCQMLALQRRLGLKSFSVMDGRDIGTAVFPDADKKFFIDADFKERVARRYKELKAAGQLISEDDVALDLKNRDTIDSTRECAPLKQAEDAIYIDTTNLTIQEVVNTLLNYVKPLNQKAPKPQD